MSTFAITPAPVTINGLGANCSGPSPKTDKPRPYVCSICHRSFGRLEHLKRHERLHTGLRPFQCHACARFFARRDLLIRHQQKLHQTVTSPSRPGDLRTNLMPFAYHEPGFGYLGNRSAIFSTNWNAADAASQPLYGSPTNVESLIDAFKEDSIGTAPLNQDESVGTVWQLSTAFDQPLVPSQPQVKAPSALLYDDCAPSNSANPPTIPAPDASTQGNLPAPGKNTQACAVTVNCPESASSDGSAKSDVEARQDLSPEHADLVSGKGTRQRKAHAGGDDGEGKKPPVKRATHNIIERRYRTNVNEKIAALRDSVPKSRIMSMNLREVVAADERDELHGPMPAHKVSKAMVFSEATEYIHELEKSNRGLLDENDALKERIAALENCRSELATTP